MEMVLQGWFKVCGGHAARFRAIRGEEGAAVVVTWSPVASAPRLPVPAWTDGGVGEGDGVGQSVCELIAPLVKDAVRGITGPVRWFEEVPPFRRVDGGATEFVQIDMDGTTPGEAPRMWPVTRDEVERFAGVGTMKAPGGGAFGQKVGKGPGGRAQLDLRRKLLALWRAAEAWNPVARANGPLHVLDVEKMLSSTPEQVRARESALIDAILALDGGLQEA